MALGIFICRPPWSLGKGKSAVDVFGDIYQASLLHLTKAAVSQLNSFSGQTITGPKKAKRGARVHSISLRLVLIERSLYLYRKHASSVIPSITYLLWAVLLSHMLYLMPRSRMGVRPWITFKSVPLCLIPEGFHVCLHSRQGGLRWSCVGKWQFPYFLLQIGHCLLIEAMLIHQASCPFVLSCAVLSASKASSMAPRA